MQLSLKITRLSLISGGFIIAKYVHSLLIILIFLLLGYMCIFSVNKDSVAKKIC